MSASGHHQLLLGSAGAGASDPHFPNVVLLLHGEGADGGTTHTDSSSFARTPSVATNITTDTERSKFGTSSIKTLTNSHLDYASSTDFQFDGDLTYEGFFYFDTTIPAYGVFWYGDLFTGNAYCAINTNGLPGYTRLGAVSVTGTDGDIVPDLWQYLAITYESATTTWRMYVDGVLVASQVQAPTAYGAAMPFAVFNEQLGTNASIICNACEIRITKGVARYTGGSMTVPTAPHPDS